MDPDDEPLLGSINSSTRSFHRVEKIKTIALVVVSVLFATTLALLIWQVTVKHGSGSGGGTNAPTPYQWLTNDIKSKMDTSANPCSDFYQYVCGGYEANTVLPPDVGMFIPVFDIIVQNNVNIMSSIANGQWPILGDFMESCLVPEDSLVDDVVATLQKLANQSILTLTSTDPKDLFPLLAQLHLKGVDAFFVPSVMNNIFLDGSDNYLQLTMSGLTLGDPAYYKIKQLVADLLSEIQTYLHVILGVPSTSPRAQAVVDLETNIAQIFGTPETFQDYFYNMTIAQLNSVTGCDYSIYTTALNVPVGPTDTIVITMPVFFQNLTSLLSTTPLQTIQDYLVVHSMVTFQMALAGGGELRGSKVYNTQRQHSFINTTFLAKTVTVNDSDDNVLSENCVDAANYLLSDFFGLLFNLMIVDQNVVDNIHDVTVGVQTAFKNALPGLSWIDEVSRQHAAEKLSEIVQIIGHPNKLERYKNVVLDPNHFMNNVFVLNQYRNTDQFSQIGQRFNRSDYEFSATVVNAFYSPSTNTINFPAGILESPMFGTSFPKMLQYARMGYVIGHETTHGFDNTGRLFDGHGVFNDIMDEKSDQNFNQHAQCLVDQYNSFQPYPGLFVNGDQTLGENIADLGGAKNAFRGYKAWVAANGPEFNDHQLVTSLTNDQLFFVMLGQTWCTKATEQAVARQIAVDVHSPSKYRVNGPLSNFDEFAKAFNCPSSSPMVNFPQCVLW